MPLIPANQAIPAFVQFLSVMAQPSDPNERANFARDFFGMMLGESFARDIIAPSDLTPAGKRLLVDSPPPLSFFTDMAEEIDGYSWQVGEILLTALTLGEHYPGLMSINNSIELQIRRRRLAGKSGLTREFLMRKWSKLKPISHFLAGLAMVEFAFSSALPVLKIWQKNKETGQIAFDLAEWQALPLNDPALTLKTAAAFENWLSIADELRRRAHRTYAQGQKVRGLPLLNEEETWHFGPEIGLPPASFSLPRPADAERDFLIQ